MTSVSQNVTLIANPVTAKRNWWENYGMDGSFWVQPFQTTATWITSGSVLTQLRNGGNATATGYVHIDTANDFVAPYYVGVATDPLITITASNSKTIQVRIPIGAVTELPATGTDNVICGADRTQPYLLWTANVAIINTGSIQATGSSISCNNIALDDGSGIVMTDAVTNQPGTANGFGTFQDYELTKANADPNYVVQHMLAYSLDSSQVNSTTPIWPLLINDKSFSDTGSVPQGYTIGIPRTTTRPTGKTRGFYLLWDVLQQFGMFYYNVAGNNCISMGCYHTSAANQQITNDIAAAFSAILPSVCILSNQTGPSSLKGFATGGVNAYPAPPPLDLTPTGGVNIAPSTFGAWYPSGYNAVPTNTT